MWFLVCFFRQCALAALNDVRQFLTDEGGQVAVRKIFEHTELNREFQSKYQGWDNTIDALRFVDFWYVLNALQIDSELNF